MKYITIIILVLITGCFYTLRAQQVPDTDFKYEISVPAYARSRGPIITMDEAHLNFHTLEGRYSPFGALLANDGYVLKAGKEKFTVPYLKSTKILVIANALGDTGKWKLPTLSAFSAEEVRAVDQWVKEGGNLFLIADHMPCAGAAANLAGTFGFNFMNGFALKQEMGREVFSRKLGNLAETPVAAGRMPGERIDSIEMFTGSAFLAPPQATVITRLDEKYTIQLASVAWEFSETTPKISGMHFVNGAMLQYGKGRVVVFGEAAMFTAQLQGPEKRKMGMNMPSAKQNPQLLLNIIHWLDGKL
jgi:hypothetical protein